MWGIGRFLTYIFGRPLSCRYIRNKCPHDLGTGYIIIDYIEESDGKMLLTIWEEKRHDSTRRANLFQDLSRIMLTLSRIPLPHIASFRLDDYGLLHLDNRPLTLRLQHLENEGIPTDIDRNQTCSTSESYTLDLLACHNNRMRCMPNSMKDEWDSRAQLASITMMRALFPHFLRCDLRNGPFSLIFTDLNQPNILVDDDWHVKCLIGLEWACFLPIEMHEEFLHYFGEQESKLPFVNGTTSYFTQIMKKGWDMGNFFYLQALVNPKGLYRIFLQNIQPRYARAHLEDEAFDRIVSAYWATDASEMVSKKLGDKTQHDNALRAEFDEGKEAKKRCDKLARFLETLPSPEDILPIPLLNRH